MSRWSEPANRSGRIPANARVGITEPGRQHGECREGVATEIAKGAGRSPPDTGVGVAEGSQERSHPLGGRHPEFGEGDHGKFPNLTVRMLQCFNQDIKGDPGLRVGEAVNQDGEDEFVHHLRG